MSRAEREEIERLKSALRRVDFFLDEFACGACSVPRTASPLDVPAAVEIAISTLRTKLAQARVDLQKTREAHGCKGACLTR